MKSYPPWPGKICTPKPNHPKEPKHGRPQKLIFFFGTKNYAWVEDSNIKPYVEHRDQIVKTIRTKALMEAVKRIDEYLHDPEKYKANADSSSEEEDVETGTASNKRRQRDKSPEVETKKATVKKTAPRPRTAAEIKKEPTTNKRIKRTRNGQSSAEDQSTINNTSPIVSGPNVTSRLNPSDILRPPIMGETTGTHSASTSKKPNLPNIPASDKILGFLGVGIMGSVKNLLSSGHRVIIWNRNHQEATKLKEMGAEVALTPCDVAEQANIIFSCVSDPLEAKELLQLIFGNGGIRSSTQPFDGKGYVEMTGLDVDTSQDIADAIVSKGGRYLEAPMLGSRVQAEEGTLILLAAGNRSLFDECRSCFEAMSDHTFYLGDVGNASKMNSICQLFAGVMLGGLAESLALADKAAIPTKDVLEVLGLTTMSSTFIKEIGEAMINQAHNPTHQVLKHMQKDLRIALSLAEQTEQPVPIAAVTNEVFKRAKRNGHSEHDVSAVYVKPRI